MLRLYMKTLRNRSVAAHEVWTSLRECYALSGTSLRWSYAMSGTVLGYGAMRCPILA